MKREVVMAIDVGTATVKTIIAERRKDEAMPYILGTGISPSHGVRRGCVINAHDVASAIKNSVKKAYETSDIKPHKAFISIGSTDVEGARSKGSVMVSRADHEISENDIKRALKQGETQLNRDSSSYLLNRDILHVFPISYALDGEEIIGNPIGMRGEKLEVDTLFITALSKHINSLIKSMDLAGIEVEDVAADCWAMSQILTSEKEKEVGCMLINVGGDTSSIIAFEEGSPISVEVFPIGSHHITYDIASGLQIVLPEAEELKISYGSDVSIKRKLSSIIEPRLNDIFELVDRHLNKIKRSKLLPAGVILTGGGTNLKGIDEIARKTLQLPVQLVQPKFPGYSKETTENPTWSVALGLCLIGLNEGSPPSAFGFGSKIKNGISKIFKNFLP
ncbi:MAG: cell division protein FtsA [Candidatus Tagabacteria bacterium CG09_land_8_20_14_0_10_41_14]|uniref:Cell division protein FtsA n=2 Tax=Candidatus Tagaibacteriota TaxID=1817918 RepID=A0A2H0WKZ8_9BACT|nr:MAG: cell division protein FtsA [Candidatus Tagabacteria bacterium CG09_land_8_20_14_0_10_41_14]PJE73259.1 MAG: cell division protein FtsA [Candidatus Tagabacteria bacterium CG10_big_fil_rev_8_21_14_0_10_40_13]